AARREDLDVPGAAAPAVGAGGAGQPVARDVGAAVVAAPTRRCERSAAGGVLRAAGGMPASGRGGLGGGGRPGGWGSEGGGTCQQCRGVCQQRLAYAAGATSYPQPGNAGPQAAVLELPALPLRETEGQVPLPASGGLLTHLRLLGTIAARPGQTAGRTVKSTPCGVRRCPAVHAPATPATSAAATPDSADVPGPASS